MINRIKSKILSWMLAFTLAVSTVPMTAAASAQTGDGAQPQPAHVHDETCYEMIPICEIEESDTHTHTEDCFEKKEICGFVFDGEPSGTSDENENNEPVLYTVKSGPVKIESDGITYSYTLNDDGTAVLTAVSSPASKQKVTVPAQITYGEETYTVTKWQLPGFFSPSVLNVTGFELPDTLTEIEGTFAAFKDLTEISIPGSVTVFTADFQSCQNLTTITFEEGVEEIACNMMVSRANALTTINLPNSLKRLSQPATFSNAVALTSIHLPDGLELLANSTFSGCQALTSIDLPASVTTLPSYTFSECTSLETVTAAGPLTTIESYSFSECESLVTIPSLSTVTEMGKGAFEGCINLQFEDGTLDLSALDHIPEKAFYGAGFSYAGALAGNAIHNVRFSDTLKSIGNYAFANCAFLYQGLSFPNSLETIGENAFEAIASGYGSSSTVVTIPDSVTAIGKKAFLSANVKQIEIGSGVTDILEQTFAAGGGATSLEKIIFNNAEDAVTIASGAIPAGVTVEWLQASIGNVGDTISSAPNAPTLQQAIADAPGDTPTTILISKDIRLHSTLHVPADKTIVIASSGDAPYTILGNRDSAIDRLIEIEAGADVSFENVVLSGAANNGSVIDNQGTLSIGGGTVVTKSKIQNASYGKGVIANEGAAAKFYMTGGSIEDNTVSAKSCGVVYVGKGAEAYLSGGSITNNKMTGNTFYDASSGVLVTGGGKCEMSGDASITGNRAIRGSAVLLYNLSKTEEKALFTLSGGRIANNLCEHGTDIPAGGAVSVEGNSTFTMTDGVIDGNTGGNGAGVCVLDNGLVAQGNINPLGTVFVMEGGVISNNQARVTNGEGGYGGGVYAFAEDVRLNGGQIVANRAYIGGGVYGAGTAEVIGTVTLKHAVVTDNTSAEQGGGLWLCATGDAKVYVTNGGAIYGNRSNGVGDDVVSVEAFPEMDSSITLADRMLGGGAVKWYVDGGVYRNNPSLIFGSILSSVDRYEAGVSEPVKVQENNHCLALKAIADPSAFALANAQKSLLIAENTATYCGGGIGSNGGIIIGEAADNLIDIPVEKIWNHGAQPETAHPVSITVKLMCGDTVMDTLVLDASTADDTGRWKGVFENLLPHLTYRIVEEAVPGYAVEITGGQTQGFTVTNTYAPETGSLSVHKIVSGAGGSTTEEFTFTVRFAGDHPAEGYPYTVTGTGETGMLSLQAGEGAFQLKHNQTITITGLPADTAYTVTEHGGSGYTVTSQTATATAGGTISGTIPKDAAAEVIFNNHKGGGGSTSSYTDVSVKKVWRLDDGGTAADAVTVALLQNGATYDTVTLNADNAWSHTWSRLDDGSIWTVRELDVPDGFTVSIDRITDNHFTITNDDVSGTPPIDPNRPTDPEHPEPPEGPENPDVPNPPDTSEVSENPIPLEGLELTDQPSLPQTGQLWWPAALAAAAGLALLLAGIAERNRSHGKPEE